jgi:hypothetical protein
VLETNECRCSTCSNLLKYVLDEEEKNEESEQKEKSGKEKKARKKKSNSSEKLIEVEGIDIKPRSEAPSVTRKRRLEDNSNKISSIFSANDSQGIEAKKEMIFVEFKKKNTEKFFSFLSF